jgi:hypothetical protein
MEIEGGKICWTATEKLKESLKSDLLIITSNTIETD